MEFQGLPADVLPIEHDVAAGETQVFALSEALMLQGATEHTKSVYVTSGDDIQVLAIYELIDHNRNSAGG